MDNLYSSLDCNQFKVGAHHNIVGMVIVFADQEPALPGDVQLYGEAHLGSEAGHAALAVSGALLHLCVKSVEWDDWVVEQLKSFVQ